jgi:hypothetical protein
MSVPVEALCVFFFFVLERVMIKESRGSKRPKWKLSTKFKTAPAWETFLHHMNPATKKQRGALSPRMFEWPLVGRLTLSLFNHIVTFLSTPADFLRLCQTCKGAALCEKELDCTNHWRSWTGCRSMTDDEFHQVCHDMRHIPVVEARRRGLMTLLRQVDWKECLKTHTTLSNRLAVVSRRCSQQPLESIRLETLLEAQDTVALMLKQQTVRLEWRHVLMKAPFEVAEDVANGWMQKLHLLSATKKCTHGSGRLTWQLVGQRGISITLNMAWKRQSKQYTIRCVAPLNFYLHHPSKKPSCVHAWDALWTLLGMTQLNPPFAHGNPLMWLCSRLMFNVAPGVVLRCVGPHQTSSLCIVST